MKMIKGNLILAAKNGEVDFVLHGCNCFSIMNGGFAKQIKYEFPEAYLADKNSLVYPWARIGSYSSYSYTDHDLTIVNIYSQFDIGTSCRKAEYGSLKRGLECFVRDFCTDGKIIGLPKICCGLGGGDWGIVSDIIEDIASITNAQWKVYCQ